ncbi:MAG: hypothetical protein ACFFB3_15000 [Candidatus Hodarchaeota archaeon]
MMVPQKKKCVSSKGKRFKYEKITSAGRLLDISKGGEEHGQIRRPKYCGDRLLKIGIG